MRVVPAILLAALFVGGCASRLPVEREAGATFDVAGITEFRPVSAERVTRESVPVVEREMLGDAHHGEAGEAGEAGEEHPRHEIGVFLGYTGERGEGGGFTVGLDYAYGINEWLSIGPFFDYVSGDVDAFAAGAGVWLRPIPCLRKLAFYAAPGVDFAHELEEAEEGGEGLLEGEKRVWETNFMLRLGGLYIIEVGHGYIVAPSFYWDWIGFEKSAYVFGLTFGKAF